MKPTILQHPYNLITRSLEEECVEFSRKLNLGMVVYNPVAAGMLVGKHSRQKAAEGTRMSRSRQYIGRYWHDAILDAVDSLGEIATKAGISLLELSYRWVMSQGVVDSVIFGVSKGEQLRSNIAASAGVLDEETLAACNTVWTTLRGPSFKYNR